MLATRMRQAGGYRPNAVSFNGSTYFSRGAGLTGAADSKFWTLSYWINRQLDVTTQRLLASAASVGGASNLTRNLLSSDNTIQFTGVNAAAGQILVLRTDVSVTTGIWYKVTMSVDMADTGKRHLYINNTSSLTAETYTNDTIDFTFADWGIGANPSGTVPMTAYLADLLMWPGVYVDLSVAANRAKFITPQGRAVDPRVAIAALGTPILGFSGPTATWHTNLLGSGGSFATATGALTTAPSAPP